MDRSLARTRPDRSAGLAACLSGLALAGLLTLGGHAVAQTLEVIEVRVDGRPVQASGSVTRRTADGRLEAGPVRVGTVLRPEMELGVPSGVVLVLATADGNRLRLSAGTRLRLRPQPARATTLELLRGGIEVYVREALDFFGVSHDRIVASVRGTTFSVDADATGSLDVRVREGTVEVDAPYAASLAGDAARPGLRVDGLRQARAVVAGERFAAGAGPAGATERYGSYEAGLAHYESLVEQADAGGDAAGRWRTFDNLLTVLHHLGEPVRIVGLQSGCRERARASGRPDALVRCLNHLGSAFVGLGRYPDAIEAFDRALVGIEAFAMPTAQALAAAIRGNRAAARAASGDLERALRDARQAVAALGPAGAGHDGSALANAHDTLGTTLMAMGRIEEGLEAVAAAFEMRLRLHGNEPHADVARSLGNLSGAYWRAGRLPEAGRFGRRALAMWRRLHPELDHPDIAILLTRLGIIEESAARADAAMTHQREALAMTDRLGARASPRLRAAPLLALARLASARGDTEDALRHAERAREELGAELGPDHPDVLVARETEAAVLVRAGRHAAAARRTRELIAAVGAPANPAETLRLAGLWTTLGLSLRAIGRPGEAAQAHERAIGLVRAAGPPDQEIRLARMRINLAGALADAGALAQAEREIGSTLATLDRAASPGTPDDLAAALSTRALVAARSGDHERAAELNARAISLREDGGTSGPSPALADAMAWQGRFLAGQGRDAEALEWLERADAMMARVHPRAGHPEWRRALLDRAQVLRTLGREREAARVRERGLSMPADRS